ncbi:MAG: HAD family hydrolase [Muribaculaceae bacterium]|nr:HAD family hydrolase [Muribaculaceae bacterium]
MEKIKNIIFDFDGTLADTSQLIVATMQRSIEELQLPFRTSEEIKATIGIRLEEIPSYLWPDIPELGEKMATVYRKNFELLKDEIPATLFPGVKETLSKLKEAGCRFAIATSRSRKSVEELTRQLGLRDFFTYMLGGDDVSEGKPNPESIFKILTELDWLKDETMMVGDMVVDILMGKNAGIRTCGVTYGNGKTLELEEAGSDFIISDFSNLTEVIQC